MTSRKFIFLLGRPGSGKSEAYEALATRLDAARRPRKHDDFPILERMARDDDRRERRGLSRRFTRSSESGWLANQIAYDEALRRIDRALVRSHLAQYRFVEFARPDMVRSIRENFSSYVRGHAFIVYLYCPWAICRQRNLGRSMRNDFDADDHRVPEEQMFERYRYDDHDQLCDLDIPYTVIDNHLERSHALGATLSLVPQLLDEV
jgi:dephospho-CoA kinase